jgi:hypothetical protein
LQDEGVVQNRVCFTLRHGDHPSRSLQQAWLAHGGDSFTFEACAQLNGLPI